MKALIFGGSGQVGTALQQVLAADELVVPGSGGLPRADLADFAVLEKWVAEARPDVVINAAAYTAVDKAETERELATQINAEAPGVLARAAQKLDVPFVHYSTDYVFDGHGDQPFHEDDPTGPLNHYGATKLAGEDVVRASGARALILRTSWVYAPQGKNFALTMLRLAGERDKLQVVDDQFGAPTSAELIAAATAQALPRLQTEPKLAGIYHLVASGITNWHGYATFLLEEAAKRGLIAKVPQIEAVSSAAFPTPAQRPKNSRLANAKFANAFGLALPDWPQGVNRLLDELAAR